MNRWIRVLGLLAVVHVLTFTALAQPVTITVWQAIHKDHQEVFQAIVDDFEVQNPEIQVEVEYISGYAAITDKFTVALIGNVPPNIVHQAHAHSYGFRHMGIFMPLNDYIEQDDTFDLGDWHPPFLEAVSLDGNIYGVPYNISSPVMYYSPQLLEESGLTGNAPTTWDEIISMGRRVTRDVTGDGEPSIWAMDMTRSPGWFMEAYLGQAGGRTLNNEGTELALNSEAGIRAWEFQQALIHTHRISRYPGAPADDLNGGRIGWWIRSSANLRGRMDDAYVPIDVAPLACDVECYAPIGGGAFYAVDTGTEEEKEATYKLLSFLGEPDNLARYAAASGYMAGRRSSVSSVYLQEAIAEYPQLMVTYEQLEHAYPETQSPEWDQVQAMWSNRPTFLDPIFQDNMPVKPVLDDLVRRGNALIQDFFKSYPRQ